MSAALTRGQLDALTALHRFGQLTPGRHSGDGRRYSRRTLLALTSAGVAEVSAEGPIVPTLKTWAVGDGTWRVSIPRTLFRDLSTDLRAARRAVARAAITGELLCRHNGAPLAPVRVGITGGLTTAASASSTVYREV